VALGGFAFFFSPSPARLEDDMFGSGKTSNLHIYVAWHRFTGVGDLSFHIFKAGRRQAQKEKKDEAAAV